MSAIILTGGIDLSVGSMVALCGMALGVLWSRFGWPVEWAAAAAVTVGIAAGAGNGLLVILGIPPLVATLATMAFYAGLAMALARGERIAGWPDHFIWLGQGKLFGVPTQLILLAFALLAGYVIVHHSRWGRWLYAFGDNPIAARFAAVPVGPLQWILYTTSGLAAGLTAVVYTAHQGAAVPDAGTGLELRTIACVVVGGTRVTGGSGGILNTLLGLVIMALLDIGLGFIESLTIPGLGLRWEFRAQHRQIVIGLLVIAVAVWNERAVRRTDS
jgi:ribose/xylose/arabinose/galactoside ABC-type transport system permease subunit